MKPRNEYQKRIVALSAKLPPLSSSQRQWAVNNCCEEIIYKTGKNKGWCSNCGGEVNPIGDTCKCPHCGRKLKVVEGKKRVASHKAYMSILATKEGFQVVRHFMVEKVTRRGCSPEVDCYECVQSWIDEKGKETIIALSTTPFPMYYDIWDINSEMSIKARRSSYGDYYCKYDIDGAIYPRMNILPTIKRNGFNTRNLGACPPVNCLIKMLLKDREAEALIKLGQYSLLCHKWRRSTTFGKLMASIKVATRHGYIINDASMWVDHIELLEFFGKDTHNPHYICPNDLAESHNKLVEKKNEIDRREKLKKQIEEAKLWESKYREEKGIYFGIVFGNSNITISVIQSVSEMAEEGSAMHHCVFSNEYFKRPDCIILTARNADGERLETIELNIRTYEIIQSRGKFNKPTEFHDDIVNLVKRHIGKFKKVA